MPQAISNNGIVAGEDSGLQAGFFLDPRSAASYTVLGIPGSYQSTVFGLNDDMELVGWYFTATQLQGYIFDPSH